MDLAQENELLTQIIKVMAVILIMQSVMIVTIDKEEPVTKVMALAHDVQKKTVKIVE